jgi:hypothetical protein
MLPEFKIKEYARLRAAHFIKPVIKMPASIHEYRGVEKNL